VSTILEALKQRDGGTAQPFLSRGDGAWSRWWWAAAGLGVLAALAALLPQRLPMAPATGAASPVALKRPAPPPARPAAPAADEPPRAHVTRWTPVAPPQATPPAVAAPTRGAEPLPAAAVEPEPQASAPASAEPSLRLESIHYSESVGHRSATLRIDGGAPVDVRQGDVVAGVEVQLILPEAVYVRRGGDVVALGEVR
jgi:hypothetical protein